MDNPAGPEVLYECSLCAEHCDEGYAFPDPAEIRQMPNGKWVCDNCWNEEGIAFAGEDDLPPLFSDLPAAPTYDPAELTRLRAENAALVDALEDIGVYGCGMLNQPAALNGPEEEWLQKRIRRMEQVARAALLAAREAEPAVREADHG